MNKKTSLFKFKFCIKRPLQVFFIALLCSWNIAGGAGEVDDKFMMDIKFTFDDNIYLDNDTKSSIYRVEVRPAYTLNFEEEFYRGAVTFWGNYRKTSDQDVEKNRFNFGGDFKGSRDFASSILSFETGFNRQSILDTEFDENGQLRRDETRDLAYARIGFQIELNQYWKMNIGDHFQKSQYASDVFSGYWNNNLSLGLQYEWDEYKTISFDFNYGHYESDADFSEPINNYGFNVNLDYLYSEALSFTVGAGGSYVEDDLFWNANASVLYKLENLSLSLGATREIVPSGLNQLRLKESAKANLSYVYSEKVDIGLAASWRNSKSTSGLLVQHIKSEEIGPWASYDLTEDIGVRLSYKFRRQLKTQGLNWGLSHAVFLDFKFLLVD